MRQWWLRLHGDQYGETLVADLCVHGVWLPQAEALFDIRVVDTDAPRQGVVFNAEVEKKNKYADACSTRRAILHTCVFLLMVWRVFFEENGMQIEYSVGQKLC